MWAFWDFCLLIMAHFVLEGEGHVNLSTGKCFIYKLLIPALQITTVKNSSAGFVLPQCTLLISFRTDACTQKF
jgi:hypothetical protein